MSASQSIEQLPLDLSYRADLGVLTLRWLRDVTFDELQTGFQAAAEQSCAHAATHWLVDVRRRALLDAFQSEWVAQQLLPRVAALLAPAPLRVAYLLSPARLENLRVLPTLAATSVQPAAHAYRLRTFAQEGLAMQWLLSAD
jgi:hypothetical protein